MPWHEASVMSQRNEFVALAQQDGCNLSQLCRRFGISRPTAYKWLHRMQAQGSAGLCDGSRRPHSSPTRTATVLEQAIVAARQTHPAWGARKLWHWLVQQQQFRPSDLPAPSTVHAILRRHGCIEPAATLAHQPMQRFEHAAPNDLWQMDFKGDVRLCDTARTRCFPLTVLDDHSRFALALHACTDQRTETVQAVLRDVFRRFGLPARMTMDNGSPWGTDGTQPYTHLTIWLLRLGIRFSHSRPFHPQTQGKDERFHRTLQVELLCTHAWCEVAPCQDAFDAWRQMYNLERPHEALGFVPPVQRYRPSERPFPELLPPLEYGPDDQVRKVQSHGRFSFQGCTYHVSKAFHGERLALRCVADGEWQVCFGSHELGRIHQRTQTTTGSVNHVPERV